MIRTAKKMHKTTDCEEERENIVNLSHLNKHSVIDMLGRFLKHVFFFTSLVRWEEKRTHDCCAHASFMHPAPCVCLISTLVFVLIVLHSETS